MNRIPDSELIINPDGSIFHLHLQPHQISDTILLVGDPSRVDMISKHFDSIEHKVQNREFATHTGYFNNKRISVISTGIGTDNIDIVINELDALVNIDLNERVVKEEQSRLNLIRIGTSGALQEDIDVDSFVLSEYGLGMDGLLHFYNHHFPTEQPILNAFLEQTGWSLPLNTPYLVQGSSELFDLLKDGMHTGITATACGFYGPQGRRLRMDMAIPSINEKLTAFRFHQHRITNFEMETSALFGLSKLLGHHAITACAIIANRIKKQYSKDYKVTVDKLVKIILERLTE
ncbi:MAG: nucleoside phosphorylase [Bacteroidota bacterium]|jgi:uridine phosphorylase